MIHSGSSEAQPQAMSPSLTEEIASRLDNAREAAHEVSLNLKPPVIALGMSERVGSNWFLDTLSDSVPTHNEPFRQQLHASHPLSTIVSRPSGPGGYRTSEMHPYERYWLANFVISKYSPEPQLVKETNLFFATSNLLDLFPDSKALVLARSPMGIASSFMQSDLFKKWNYAERYNQLKAMTLQPKYEHYRFIFGGEHDPGSLRQLTRLIVLNTLCITESLEGRDHMVVRYEDSVTQRELMLTEVADFLSNAGIALNVTERPDVGHSNHVFSTRKKKTSLEASLDKSDAQIINDEVRRLLSGALSVISIDQYDHAQNLLESGNDKYDIVGRKTIQNITSNEKVSQPAPVFEFVTLEDSDLKWGNQPVTNQDFLNFLNSMHREGIPNVINGTQLFVNENMIPARGGRIWFNSNSGEYEVTPGYDFHPVYWVTWLAAAAFARYSGGRLPDKQEMEDILSPLSDINFSDINCDHKESDVHANGHTPAGKNGIYDLLGNVASWCRDGFLETPGSSLDRYIYGTAWNREGSLDALKKPNHRPLSGSSRSVGIRLISDKQKELSAAQLAERFDGWFAMMSSLTDISRTDRYIVDQLTY